MEANSLSESIRLGIHFKEARSLRVRLESDHLASASAGKENRVVAYVGAYVQHEIIWANELPQILKKVSFVECSRVPDGAEDMVGLVEVIKDI